MQKQEKQPAVNLKEASRANKLQKTISALQDFNNNLHINSPPVMHDDKVIKSLGEKYPKHRQVIKPPLSVQQDITGKKPSPMGFAEGATILKRYHEQKAYSHQ